MTITTFVVLFAAWFTITGLGIVDEGTVPSPGGLWDAGARLLQNGYSMIPLWDHLVASARRVFLGFGIALLCGIPIGVLCGYSRVINAIVAPIFGILRPIPAIAFIPLVILYFGIGETSKIVVITFSTTLYLVLNTEAGVRSVPQAYYRAAANVEATRFQVLRRIVIPSALPQIFVGVRVAISLSWALVVAAELVSAQSGLGYIIMNAALFFRIHEVYLGVVMIALLAVLTEWGSRAAEDRIVHWRGK